MPKNDDFYRNLNMESITDLDYNYAKRVCKGFEIKMFGEYHDLYPKNDTLLVADDFEKFRKICLGIYELDPSRFPLAPGLT